MLPHVHISVFLLLLPFLLSVTAVTALPFPGLEWKDERGLQPPSSLPVPESTYLLIAPENCPAIEIESLSHVWEQLADTYPDFLWSANCNSKSAHKLCTKCLHNRWLDPNGPQILKWESKKWGPVLVKDMKSLYKDVGEAFEHYMSKLSHQHENDKLKLARALVARQDGELGDVRGQVLMLTNQLPVWFNCTTYQLKPGGVGSQSSLAFLTQNFFTPMKIQRQYYGGVKPWHVHWKLPATEKGSFLWSESGAFATTKKVSLLKDVGADSSDSSHRKCLLEWDRSVGGGGGGGGGETVSYQVNSQGSESVIPDPDTANAGANAGASLLIELDTGRAYDWFRFRFLEFANIVASRVREKFSAALHQHQTPIVVYDPVGKKQRSQITVHSTIL